MICFMPWSGTLYIDRVIKGTVHRLQTAPLGARSCGPAGTYLTLESVTQYLFSSQQTSDLPWHCGANRLLLAEK